MAKYIYQNKDWTRFTWQDDAINAIFGEVRNLQGRIIGQMNSMGYDFKEEATLKNITMDVLKSSEIEGEFLNYEQVRSSIARQLGMDVAGMVPVPRNVDGIVQMMLDATRNFTKDLTEDRLFGWHSALFPIGRSGIYNIEVGAYRSGEMQVISGSMGNEKVHYEAPGPGVVKSEMDKFIAWFNADSKTDPVLKAAIAHLWFVTIHPFDDGNGRIGRALTDMLLTLADGHAERYYSMSNQIAKERNKYYAVLEKVQHSDGDITAWMVWFLHCLNGALQETEHTLKHILNKANFWLKNVNLNVNERQRFMLNKMLDGIEGKMKTVKWAKMAKCSHDTALRDIRDLMNKSVLHQEEAGGRSTNYELNDIA